MEQEQTRSEPKVVAMLKFYKRGDLKNPVKQQRIEATWQKIKEHVKKMQAENDGYIIIIN